MAASLICTRAVSGCRFTAPNRVSDSFVVTLSAPGQNGAASAIVCWSPVTRAIGTRYASAASALMPLSPARVPFTSTCEITCGL